MNTQHRHRPLPLDCLRSFEAVARHLNFSAAADELHLTQPAMSRQIQRLEDELGTALFTRGTRRVALTAAGHSLIRVVEPMLARLDATVRQIRLAQGRAQVSVSTFASFATLWLMPRLPGFERGREGVDIRLSATDRLMELDSPELDLLLRHCKPERAPSGAWRLFGEVLTPVVGASLAAAIAQGAAAPLKGPADLTAHTLLELDDGAANAAAFCWPAWLAPHGLIDLVPRRWISVNFTHQQVQAALAGQGVALARLSMVHDMLARGELVEPFGAAARMHLPWAYWLIPLVAAEGDGGAGAPRRPELADFTTWLLDQARITAAAMGEPPPARRA